MKNIRDIFFKKLVKRTLKRFDKRMSKLIRGFL
jgi:hypothetical protein